MLLHACCQVMQNDLVPHNRKVSVSASGMAQLEAAMAEKLEMQVRAVMIIGGLSCPTSSSAAAAVID